LSLAVVRDLRVARAPVTAEDLAALQTDVLAGFVLARAAAGLPDGTIASDVLHLEQVRAWFGRPLWDMEPPDADAYFGKVPRDTAKGTRLSRAQALKTCFLFELRHKAEIHQMTGRIVECPIDEMNRPRGRQQAKLRIPPTAAQVGRLFAGWREELATCRKFAPAARNYTACRLLSEVGLRVNEACKLDLPDIKWELGRFGKLHVRHGKGARGSGPRERMVPLINTQARRCAGSSRTCGASSATTTPGPGCRCCPPNARTPMAAPPGSATRRSGRRWPRPPRRTCRTGPTWSLRMSFAISAPASSTWAAWT
jgi:integrase